jgi:membrane-anchored protein YejM (alkaline phosphatase superfamily)
VYISDNPWYGRLFEQLDSELYYYHIGDRDAFDGAVTHPETMTDIAIEQVTRYPDKRAIVHYLQPHDPWFDTDGTELFSFKGRCPYHLRRQGYTPEKIQAAYESSLELVLDELKRLLNHLTGKTIITADHGELLNDRMRPIPIRQYEHPEGIYTEQLVKVPWFVVDYDQRKEITTAHERGDWNWDDPDRSGVEQQLENLGYISG